MQIVEINTRYLRDREGAHEYLKEVFQFPEYYGRNLDALHDCLTELDDVDVTFINPNAAGAYGRRILQVFVEASRMNGGLVLHMIDD